MKLGDSLRELLAQMEWADAELWRAVLATPGIAGDARALELLQHVHQVQWVYLALWRGEEPALLPEDAFDGLDGIHAWGRAYHEQAVAFAATSPDWGSPVSVPWAEQLRERFGRVHTASLADTVVQVAMHSMYHRAQLNTRIRDHGGTPANVDYIMWVWAGKPGAEWPDAAASAEGES